MEGGDRQVAAEVPAVYECIAKVSAELSKYGIGKDRKNQQQGFMFRGIDDVYQVLSPLLPPAGLVIIPRVLSHTVVERETQKGGAIFSTVCEIEFDLVAVEDGSKHTARIIGEAMDTGDKGTNKCMSIAYKYLVFQLFCVPIMGAMDDPDSEAHDVSARKSASPYSGPTATHVQPPQAPAPLPPQAPPQAPRQQQAVQPRPTPSTPVPAPALPKASRVKAVKSAPSSAEPEPDAAGIPPEDENQDTDEAGAQPLAQTLAQAFGGVKLSEDTALKLQDWQGKILSDATVEALRRDFAAGYMWASELKDVQQRSYALMQLTMSKDSRKKDLGM